MTTTFAESIEFSTANREQFPEVPEAVDLTKYVVIGDGSGISWILATAESADALDLSALKNSEMTDYTGSEYGEFWSAIAEHVDMLADCNGNMSDAALAICAREGVEAVEQD